MTAGRELDALIAEKVMGWKRMTYAQANPGNKHYAADERLTWTWFDSNDNETKRAVDSDCVDCGTDFLAWSPSTDIKDAWEVVEKLRMTLTPTHDGGWIAQTRYRYREPDLLTPFDAKAPTAPHAICLAALEAVGHE